jgi:hypothetical protein
MRVDVKQRTAVFSISRETGSVFWGDLDWRPLSPIQTGFRTVYIPPRFSSSFPNCS